MSLHILIADPSSKWLSEANAYFRGLFYEVTSVENGKSAQLAIYNNSQFFAAVINLDLTNSSGLQVLKYIKAKQPGLKTILLVPSAESMVANQLDSAYLQKLGVNEILQAPYSLEQVKVALEGYQNFSTVMEKGPVREGQSEVEELSVEDRKFTSIKIDEFVSGQAVHFDIFIRLDSGKYLKILHSGDSFSQERIRKYKKEKNVQFLYFLNEDRGKFIRFANYLSEKTMHKENVNTEAKAQLIKNIGEKFVEELYMEGMKPQILEMGKSLCQNIYNIVHAKNDLSTVLRQFEDFNAQIYSHSYLVCLFSSMIVKQFEWDSRIVQETVGMAALMHDIGYMKLPEKLLHMRPENMGPEDLQLYQTHPELALEVLKGNNLVTPVVKQVILQHHENSENTGFPGGLRKDKILTLAKIVFVCDEFVHLMMEKKVIPPEALKILLSKPRSVKRYSSYILENFAKIFVEKHALPHSDDDDKD